MKLPVKARLADPGDVVIVDADGQYICATHSGPDYMDHRDQIVAAINTAADPLNIIITISGGIVQDVENPRPASIDVEVRDYDNGEAARIVRDADGEYFDEEDRVYGKDDDDNFYSITIY